MHLYGESIDLSCFDFPCQITDDTIENFCNLFTFTKICTGITGFDEKLKDRIQFKEPFPGKEANSRVAYAESSYGHVKLFVDNFNIARSVNCERLLFNEKSECCSSCKTVKINTLYTQHSKDETTEKQSNKYTNHRWMDTDGLTERIKTLTIEKKALVRKVSSYSVQITKLLERKGVQMTKGYSDLCAEIMEKNTMPEFPDGSPQSLLWSQQLEQLKLENKRTMRWHPLIVRWCLSIYMTSPAAYKQMASKRNKLLILPHENTLKKYINFTKPESGFNIDIIDCLIKDSKVEKLPEGQKNVSLIFDEIKIKSGLIYRKSSGEIIGFTEMGDLNEEIERFKDTCEKTDADDRDFATYVNVFMVRGICSKLCYPFGYHAGLGFSADQLFPLVWEATYVLESIGFYVRAWVCDGASPNRKFFKINALKEDYWTWNLFDPTRKIFLFSDTPHLLKTTRNNLENSLANKNSRNLHVSTLHTIFISICL